MASQTHETSNYEQGMLFQPLLLSLPHQDWLRRTHLKGTLKTPRQIHIVGTGSSYHVALWGKCLYETHGLSVAAHHSLDVADKGLSPISRSDLAIVISHRGAQSLTAEVMKRLKPNGARCLLICGEQSPTGGYEFLAAAAPEESKAHTQSLIGAICALSTLLALLKPALSKSLEKQRELAAEFLVDQLALPFAKKDLPKAGLHFVGADFFEAVGLELRLKSMEVPHISAQFHHLEEFLHGPIAAVEKGDVVALLTDQALSKKSLQRRRALACGLAAKEVGARILQPPAATHLHVAWQAVAALAWGQSLCLEAARSRGFDPDSNRHENPRYAAAFRHAKLK